MPATATSRLEGLTTSVAVKAPCKVATNAAITLSGEQTVNGVAVTAGDRVLVKNQASSVDNGIWNVQAGTWTRALDFNGSRDAVKGTIVPVVPTSGGTVFYQVTTANPVTIGSSNLTFATASPVSLDDSGVGIFPPTAGMLNKMLSIDSGGAVVGEIGVPDEDERPNAIWAFDVDGETDPMSISEAREIFRGAPGGTPAAVGTFTSLSGQEIDEGVDTVRSIGYSTAGIGGAWYVYDAAVNAGTVATYPRSQFLAADLRGFRLSTDQWVTPYMFGATSDETFATNQRAAIQAFWDWYKANPTAPINVTIACGVAPAAANDEVIITIGPDSEPVAKPARTIVGHMWLRVVAGSDPAIVICRVQNLTRTTWHGGLRAEGPASMETFAQRTDYAVGVELVNCGRMAFTDMVRGDRTWLFGVIASTANCNFLRLDHIWTTFNGSGADRGSHGAKSLVGSWSAPERGEMWDDDANPDTVKVYRADPGGASSNSTDQRTRLTIDNFPPNTEGTDTLEWMHPSNIPYQIRLVGDDRLYEVRDWDVANGYIYIYPWIDPALGASGTYEWVFGGGWGCRSGDGQIIVDRCTVTDSGNGAVVAAQYAAKGRNWNFTSNGTGLVVGRAGGTATCMGLQVDNFYVESNTRDLCFITPASFAAYGYINSDTALSRDKVYELSQPRDFSTGVIIGEAFKTREGGWHVMCAGRELFQQIPNEITGTTYTLQLIDAGSIHRTTNGSATTITIPPRTSVKFRKGDYFDNVCGGAGPVSYAAGAGVTILGMVGPYPIGAYLRSQKVAEPDTWRVMALAGGVRAAATYDPGSIASGASATTTVAVTGAALGDQYAASFSNSLQGLTLTAYVSAADTVTCVFGNLTGGAVDLASGTLAVTKVN